MDFHRIDPHWCFDPELDDLERLSNSVVDLIESGDLDEADRRCVELKTRFPEQPDWLERSARVCVARGQIAQAIDYYQRCLVFIDENPDGFDEDSRECYQEQIDRLRSRQPGPRADE